MSAKPLILLLESSTSVCSVALADDNSILAIEETLEGNRHSQWMTLFIEDVLQKSNKTYSDITAIGISQGPGSYTGLRVAYSVAKGIAYNLGIPIIEVDTLSSIALSYISTSHPDESVVIIPMIDARRMEVYWQHIDYTGQLVKPTEAHILDNSSFDSLLQYKNIIALGDGAPKILQLDLPKDILDKITVVDTLTSAAHLRFEAIEKHFTETYSDVAYCTPSYLKSPNITVSKKKLLS